ncbi:MULTISPECIES: flagellar biosynthesis anti-sigma factor FlgM [unclassified Paenibacillus]|uniref:flagellar biosynthesis anti-sigma factor FlgM n=1 Tax=unclassified Paenibacillus TaxID=185978 RepID=UPI001AE5B713|nr:MULTISPECIES: flagellar biosynthesis anti-sigma factor FlgM [unclassified Paenibacillus]MBP1157808.1 negative regulator of flagellin synthesis FlgM [Paenibacillus sp. PvP091]MBP1171456.1 negative regulator of flagellin synthesis FlgM [Paenibacillus sp. PvR098]MBP2442484.1 negative regulator of flagellin synthesis FlgM [Paenibacillus sp. PvP052]
MKINGTNQVSSVNQYKKSQEYMQTAASDKKSKSKDQVEISDVAKELHGNSGIVSADRERLDELKKSVKAGTYHVDARTVAEKIFPFLKS